MKSFFKRLLPSRRPAAYHLRSSVKASRNLSYQTLQPRQMLTADLFVNVAVGDVNSGIAVSDDASGPGFFFYSAQDVHQRFANIPADNADHLVATRLDGAQWQYNDDTSWVDFEPVLTDRVLAEVNFDSNRVSLPFRSFTAGVRHSINNEDLYFAADRFGGNQDVGEFEVLGTEFRTQDITLDPTQLNLAQSQIRLSSLGRAALNFEMDFGRFPNLAIFDDSGAPLLSWRVQLLPYLGYDNLYEQFRLDEAWDSPHNLSLLSEMPEIYSSPYFESATHTNFLALAGENTMTPSVSERVTFGDIDNEVALYVEANQNRATQWTRPRDLPFNPANPFSGLGDTSPEGFSFVTTRGQTLTIDESVSAEAWNGIVDRDDGFVVTAEILEDNAGTENDLRDLGLAALNYESAFQRFPGSAIISDSGQPLLSWRVTLLPLLGHQNLYDQFRLDEPWDSPHNLALLPMMPQVYAVDGIEAGFTTYLATTGQDTLFPDDLQGIGFGQITDGSENTVLFVKADDALATQWTRPVDLPFDAANPRAGLGYSDDGGFHAVTAGGETIFVEDAISDLDVASLLQRNDLRTIDQDVFPVLPLSQNLRRVGLATLNFESARQGFPTQAITADDGTPLLSWRVAILPYIEQNNLYQQFNLDEPWDSPNNIALLPLMPRFYAVEGIGNGIEDGMTTLLGIAGEEGLFAQGDRGFNFGDIIDGAGNTALIVQANADQATQWTKPQDIDFDPSNPASGVGDATASGFHAVFANGSVHFIPNTVADETIGHILQRDDGELFDQSFLFGQQLRTPDSFQRQNNLQQIALAQLNHESARMEFTQRAIFAEDGTPLLSWRVAILPFLGHQNLYDQFNLDEPWDSPNNIALLPLMPQIYAHPEVENGQTVFKVFVGDETAFLPESSRRGLSFGNLRDGSSNTIMVVETSSDNAVPWTQPVDVEFDANDPKAELGHGLLDNFAVAFFDGSVHRVSNSISDSALAALVTRDGGEVIDFDAIQYDNEGAVTQPAFSGTAGDDTINVSIGSETITIDVNGATTIMPAADFDDLFFDAVDGNDTLNVQIDTTDNQIQLGPDVLSVAGTLNLLAEGFQTVRVTDTTGDSTNSITLGGTAGEDLLRGGAESATLMAGESVLIAEGFQDVTVDAGEGNDRSLLTDSAGDDRFFASPLRSLLMMGEQSILAIGFERSTVNSINGGRDFADLRDSDGDDVFSGGPTYGFLSGDGFQNTALNFANVIATSTGGVDVSYFLDSQGDDFFYTTPDLAMFRGDGFRNQANGFASSFAQSQSGDDIATFRGSLADEAFYASSTVGRFSTGDVIHVARGFGLVNAFGLGGSDSAFLSDSDGNDRFYASPQIGYLYGDGFRNIARGFQTIQASASNGSDVATLQGSSGADDYYSTPQLAVLSGQGYRNLTVGFDRMTAIGGGGSDAARLIGSSGNDSFYGNSNISQLSGAGYVSQVNSFSSVYAFGGGGNDFAALVDSSDDDRVFANSSSVSMTADSYVVSVSQFSVSSFFARNGGVDVAYMDDSEGDDFFTAQGTRASLATPSARYNSIGFDRVVARAINGGTDFYSAGDTDFQLVRSGNWQ